MSNVLISYDVSDKNPKMKAALIAEGYLDRWDNVNLPNTTLWKAKTSSAEGHKAMEKAATGLQIILERAVAVEFGIWTGTTPGKKHV